MLLLESVDADGVGAAAVSSIAAEFAVSKIRLINLELVKIAKFIFPSGSILPRVSFFLCHVSSSGKNFFYFVDFCPNDIIKIYSRIHI